MPLPPNVRCGPAGWAYPHWNGIVYPRSPQQKAAGLELVSRYFDMVEVNRTFYQPIRSEVARLWMAQVSDNPRFLFTVKLNRRFTHDRDLDAHHLRAFTDGLGPLLGARKLGCILMQFPWTFCFTAENRDYFIRLRRALHEFPLVAEMRHSSWTAPEAIGTFIDYHVGFCNIDQTPSPTGMPKMSQLTTRVGYVRLHGRAVGPTPQHLYLYPQAELTDWARRIGRMAEIAANLFVVTNNDGGGRAVVNALQLARLLGDDRALAPPDLVRRYPVALEHFNTERPVQRALFAA